MAVLEGCVFGGSFFYGFETFLKDFPGLLCLISVTTA